MSRLSPLLSYDRRGPLRSWWRAVFSGSFPSTSSLLWSHPPHGKLVPPSKWPHGSSKFPSPPSARLRPRDDDERFRRFVLYFLFLSFPKANTSWNFCLKYKEAYKGRVVYKELKYKELKYKELNDLANGVSTSKKKERKNTSLVFCHNLTGKTLKLQVSRVEWG